MDIIILIVWGVSIWVGWNFATKWKRSRLLALFLTVFFGPVGVIILFALPRETTSVNKVEGATEKVNRDKYQEAKTYKAIEMRTDSYDSDEPVALSFWPKYYQIIKKEGHILPKGTRVMANGKSLNMAIQPGGKIFISTPEFDCDVTTDGSTYAMVRFHSEEGVPGFDYGSDEDPHYVYAGDSFNSLDVKSKAALITKFIEVVTAHFPEYFPDIVEHVRIYLGKAKNLIRPNIAKGQWVTFSQGVNIPSHDLPSSGWDACRKSLGSNISSAGSDYEVRPRLVREDGYCHLIELDGSPENLFVSENTLLDLINIGVVKFT